MNDSQVFIDFVEGALDSENEQEFAGRFAYDSEFRSEFKGFLKITGEIKKNAKLFAPASAATNKIFSELGYPPPTVVEKKGSNFASRRPIFYKRFLTHFLAGASAAVLSIIGTLFFLSPVRQAAPDPVNAITEAAGAIPESINTTQTFRRESLIHQKPGITRPIINENSAAPFAYNEVNPERLEKIRMSTPERRPALPISDQEDRNGFATLKNFLPPFEEPKAISSTGNEIGFSIEVRNAINWNLPKETITPSHWAKLNNTGLAFLYKLSDKLDIGADVRQETFFVRYEGMEGDLRYRYEQQPNLTSYALLSRYKLGEAGYFGAFSQIAIGANKAGYVARPMLGVEFRPVGNFAFVLGAEYNFLEFYHQNKWFGASKFSLNYGLNYKF